MTRSAIPAWCKGCGHKGLRHKTEATSEEGEDIRQDLQEGRIELEIEKQIIQTLTGL
jgi:hypothetical protein